MWDEDGEGGRGGGQLASGTLDADGRKGDPWLAFGATGAQATITYAEGRHEVSHEEAHAWHEGEAGGVSEAVTGSALAAQLHEVS
jgi:hypothetical protein